MEGKTAHPASLPWFTTVAIMKICNRVWCQEQMHSVSLASTLKYRSLFEILLLTQARLRCVSSAKPWLLCSHRERQVLLKSSTRGEDANGCIQARPSKGILRFGALKCLIVASALGNPHVQARAPALLWLGPSLRAEKLEGDHTCPLVSPRSNCCASVLGCCGSHDRAVADIR